MRALCWKELRENIRWALLAMIGLGFAQWYALNQSDDNYTLGYNWSGKGLLLDSPAFLAVTTFGCAAVGLLLGLVQILPELRRDQWAALLHRPVTRGTVFRGKVAGGLLLYALGTVPPFLYSVWRVATPGHFAAPFVPEMALAGTADLCAGIAFYFAALAMTLPRGVWFGVRVLPLFAAVHLISFVQDTELFRVAVEAAVLMSLLLFTAGWATLLHQDRLGPRPWIGKAACLGVMFYGACGLGDLTRSVFGVIGPTRHSRSTEVSLSDTGIPLRVTDVDNVVVSVTDLAGNPTTDKRFAPDQVRSHLKWLNWCSRYIGDNHGWNPPDYYSYRNFSQYATFNRAYSYPRPEQWFYLVHKRVWIVYSPVLKVPLARLDRRGFVPVASPPQPFDAETRFEEWGDRLIQHDPARARLISLPGRRFTDFTLPGPGPIYGLGTAYAKRLQGDGGATVFGLTLADRLAVYDEQGTLAGVLPYHQDVTRWGQLSLGMTGDKERFYLRYAPTVFLPRKVREAMPDYLEVINAQGETLQTYTLPPEPPPWRSRDWPEYAAEHLQSTAFFFGGMAYQKVGALLGSKRLADQWQYRWGHERELNWQLAVFAPLLSLALAAGAWWQARRARFATRRALEWTLFVFAFGVAGWIAFRVAADWPQFVLCPRCRRARPVDDARCPHCGAEWPAVPSEGLEIFDDGAAVFAQA